MKVDRPDIELIERIKKLPTASVYTALWKLNYRNIWMKEIKPITVKETTLCGPAITLRYVPFRREEVIDYRESSAFKAIESIKKGDLMVCDAIGFPAGVFGDCMVLGLKEKGGIGLIIDGGVRDTPQIKKLNFPVFAKYVTPAHIHGRVIPIEFNSIIQCGGVQVRPGDVILADADGVVCIPKEVLLEVIEEAEKTELLDEESRRRILSGLPIYECYPPREEWLTKNK